MEDMMTEWPGRITSTSIVENEQRFHEAKRGLVETFERSYLQAKLRKHQWNISAVSRESGLSRKHIRTLMQKHSLYAHCRLSDRSV